MSKYEKGLEFCRNLVYDLNGTVVGLSDLKQFNMTVEQADHKPRLAGIPSAECFEIGKSYSDTLIVTDLDLLRDATTGFTEKLTLSVVLLTVIFPSIGSQVLVVCVFTFLNIE
jgi:hypothetical protein